MVPLRLWFPMVYSGIHVRLSFMFLPSAMDTQYKYTFAVKAMAIITECRIRSHS
jgi:hypothetical protein